jgi:kinesin family protein 6/9
VTADPRLEEVIRQRDEEINVLLKTLKQERRKIAELEARLRTTAPEERGGAGEEVEERKEERVKEERGTETTGEQEAGERKQAESRKAWKSELSRARQEAFDQFRRDCPIMDQVNQHKTDLRTKYSEAKALGEEVQSSRTTINELKGQLEKHRISQGLAGLTRGVSSEVDGQEERERELKTKIEAEKARCVS